MPRSNIVPIAPDVAVSEQCIPFTEIPHSSKLFLDYLYHHERVAEFYPRTADRSWLGVQARTVQYDTERRRKVADVLERQNRAFGASPNVLEALRRFRNGAVVTVTGQQVGLFGGPLYSLLKAASAINAARELERSGIDAVPVFWLATEDHDVDEIDHALFPVGVGGLKRLQASSRAQKGAPVGKLRFGPEIESVAAEAAALCGGDVADAIQEAYRQGETYGSAYGKLFARIFHEYGLILLDPLDTELHRIAEPIYSAAMERAEEIDQGLLARGKQLREAGYHEQVKVTGESTLLFCASGGERRVIHRANGDFMVGAEKISRNDLLTRIKSHPEDFSPNVLLRPVVQDYLLPTVTYFGGAAEVAYFAQCAVVYEKLLGRVTPILARLSATILNQRMQRLMKRYRLALPELFHGVENLQQLLGSRAIPEGISDALDAAATAIRENIGQMKDALNMLDETLLASAEKASKKMLYQVERLRRRASAAELQRDAHLARDARELIARLYPDKMLQERELAGVVLLAEHGPEFLDRLIQTAKSDCGAHQLIEF